MTHRWNRGGALRQFDRRFYGPRLFVPATVPAALLWNSADKSADITLSNGDRTATNSVASHRMVRALAVVPSYKCYFEFTVDKSNLIIGVANSSQSLSSYVGSSTNSWGWQVASGSKVYYNGSNWSYTGAGDCVDGDKVMIAIDLAAQKMWGGRNGTWHNSGDPAAGTGSMPFGTAIPTSGVYVAAGNNSANQFVTIKQTADYTVPTGFTFVPGG